MDHESKEAAKGDKLAHFYGIFTYVKILTNTLTKHSQ